jgi:tripartite-type tricarboxylate transporter receptor subunit TctC
MDVKHNVPSATCAPARRTHRHMLRARCAKLLRTAAAAAAAVLLASTAGAQAQYPDRPVKFLVPLAAGGGGDVVARLVAKAMAPALGQPVVVENRPGANGIVGTEVAARAAPDGYTLMLGSLGTHSVNPSLYTKLPYDPARDFIPVSLIALYDNVVVVPAASPIKTIDDLVQTARRKPGTLNYGITVIGNSAHLAAEQFKHETKIDVVGIPYDNAAKATIDLQAGRLDYLVDNVLVQHPHIASGKVRALATTATKRSPDLPNVPTLTEAGFPSQAIGWLGLFVQAGTPQPVIDRLFAALKKAYESPELRARSTPGLDLSMSASPREFADYVAAERVRWAKVIQASKIKID